MLPRLRGPQEALPAGMLPHGSQMLAEPVPGWGSRSVHGAQGGADQFVRIRVRMVFQVGGDRLAGLHLLIIKNMKGLLSMPSIMR